MGELSRRRNARDVWVSRGHLWAAAASAGIAVLLAFLVGTVVGRSSASAEQELVADYSEEELIALLARIEASASRAGGVDRLTYPDALAGQTMEVGLPEAPALPGQVDVAPPPMVDLPGVSAPPNQGVGARVLRTSDERAARATVESLVAAGLPVWVHVERSGGLDVVEVGVGPWLDETEGVLATAPHDHLLPVDLHWDGFGEAEDSP